jgi:hypothetical protein
MGSCRGTKAAFDNATVASRPVTADAIEPILAGRFRRRRALQDFQINEFIRLR